ncbi:S9 family peptidase [Aurantiacibacter poecillastricola]|uniref:S9 family peptidase n=1 Tax=Aurantiacibacter poecillastricola TaxID=3064385 RepID=UPI00273EFE5A|nr:S9 family peptidase [Aurantiacibacter sp. 219JJ12-13]MDP5263086.1 S9 family peptidase [Aurantiacibacter sp. 219JJ12-13]
MTLTRSALLATALTLPFAPALAREMTPQDVARVEYTGAVAVSQDGSRIAFTRVHRPDVTIGEENGGAEQQLYLADGPMNVRAYLPEDMSISGIDFTPDGSMITFLWANGEDDRSVWGIPVNGGAYRKLGGVADAAVRDYAFSPDGELLYMLASAAPDEDREAESEDGFNAVVYEEEFQFNRMFVADVSGTDTDAEPRAIEVPGFVSSFDISPDGETAMIVTAPTPLVDDSLTSQRVNLVNLATGDVTVVQTPGKLGDVEFSPDSSQLSMVAGVDENDPAAVTLHLVDVATGDYRALNEGAAEAVVDTEWMADGRLAAVVHVGAQSVLRFYGQDGNEEREFDPGELILTSLEQGGNRLVLEANAPTHPNELFAFNGGEFQRWTDSNPWLAEIDFAPQRTVTYTATDGQQIEGILVEPLGGVPAGGAPTIFDVHGGPEAHESNGWVTNYGGPGQVAAGQGYAVFLPNYRGSTAYGVAFSKAHSGNYTDPEFRDLVDAKNFLVNEGIADPDRVGITGGSYGGYATAWSSTYNSEEFAAGVMFVGISNQISKVGTGDIPNEMYLVHARQWPWEDWQHFLEVSPIYYTDRADTPLLIMGGTADTRVDPGQSLELYRYIKLRRPDTPLRLVRYPGEGHGNAMAAAQYDYNLRMMQWFDTYLKTGDRDAELPPARPELMIEED